MGPASPSGLGRSVAQHLSDLSFHPSVPPLSPDVLMGGICSLPHACAGTWLCPWRVCASYAARWSPPLVRCYPQRNSLEQPLPCPVRQ